MLYDNLFPGEFPIKIIAWNNSNIKIRIMEILKKHIATFNPLGIVQTLSSAEKYCCFTVSVFIKEQSQLEAITADFKKEPDIIMAL